MNILYKYRSLDAFRFFIDILKNKNLYAAKFTELNDPMEGVFTLSEGILSKGMERMIHAKKTRYRICALSRKMNSTLMWAHYADSHRGIVLGVEPLEDPEYRISEVKYVSKLSVSGNGRSIQQLAEEILFQKLDNWKYEEEVRILTAKMFVPIKIKRVLIGCRADDDEVARIKFLFKGVVDGRCIRQISRSELDTGTMAEDGV